MAFNCLQSEQKLRKAVSDVSCEIDKYEIAAAAAAAAKIIPNEDVEQAECDCCGLKEYCTLGYISKVKGSHSGNWVCGLCSEAVKERLERSPAGSRLVAMHEAVSSHRDFCQKFNNTTRLNPKLSLTFALRDIAKRSGEKRSMNSPISSSRLARSSSCVPRIN